MNMMRATSPLVLQRSSCILYYWLFCAVTIYVRCMVRTTLPYSCTARLLSRWRISATGSYP